MTSDGTSGASSGNDGTARRRASMTYVQKVDAWSSSSSSVTQAGSSPAGRVAAQDATSWVFPLPAGPVTTVIGLAVSGASRATNSGRATENGGDGGITNFDGKMGLSGCIDNVV